MNAFKALGALGVVAALYVLVPRSAPVAQAVAAPDVAQAEPRPVSGASAQESQYVAAIEKHYIPAKRAAEASGKPSDWHRAYTIVATIKNACDNKAAWDYADVVLLESVAVAHSETRDWQATAYDMARSAAGCVRTRRSAR